MQSPRLICIGSNLESQIALQDLVAADVPVQALITRPASSPGGASDYVDLHDFCAGHNIACVDTININSQETIERIAELKPDCLFVLGWSQLLGAELLALPAVCCIGSHPSLLPFGRGRAPVPWTILQGLEESAVTLFKMELDADAGDIAWQATFNVQADWHAMDLYREIAGLLGNGFTQVYEAIAGDKLKFQPQNFAQSTYREKRGPADGWIDFSQDAVIVDRLIRAVSQPFPGAYSYHRNHFQVLTVITMAARLRSGER
jgi:methionyl-tRNA formyltransferase